MFIVFENPRSFAWSFERRRANCFLWRRIELISLSSASMSLLSAVISSYWFSFYSGATSFYFGVSFVVIAFLNTLFGICIFKG